MKNAFYFMSKTVFVLEIFTFLYCLFVYVEKPLDKKTEVNFEIYDVADWKTNILSNISKSKGSQAMEFGT